MALVIRPIELRDANAFVERLHRHHKPVVGHRFSISAWNDETLHGIAIVGRPVARHYLPLEVVEVTRLCTDGTRNACSILYAAAARAARAMGYLRIQTYTLFDEPGVSLRAAGWECEGEQEGKQWKYSEPQGMLPFANNINRRTDQPTCNKLRWAKDLSGGKSTYQ